jgi:hypothetical protein
LTARGSNKMAKKSLPTEPLKASTVSENVIAKRSHEDEARERRYRAEDALRVMEKAEEHRKDKALMRDVKQMAKEKVKCLSKIK